MDFASLEHKNHYEHHHDDHHHHNPRYRAEVKSLTRTLEQLQKHGATLGVPLPGIIIRDAFRKKGITWGKFPNELIPSPTSPRTLMSLGTFLFFT